MLRCMLHCWDNSPKAYSKRSVLDLACESTFWLIPSLPQCLSWLWMLSVLSSTSCDNPFLSLESLVITELKITELSVKFAKLQNSEYECGLIMWGALGVVKVTNLVIRRALKLHSSTTASGPRVSKSRRSLGLSIYYLEPLMNNDVHCYNEVSKTHSTCSPGIYSCKFLSWKFRSLWFWKAASSACLLLSMPLHRLASSVLRRLDNSTSSLLGSETLVVGMK